MTGRSLKWAVPAVRIAAVAAFLMVGRGHDKQPGIWIKVARVTAGDRLIVR
ncbi:MAG: hypothetical protein F2889_02090 [Actinobacteria bacterium]|uniref:Unannotated protein n=1 Tax=freshwater metagenome TaxID=449393 RepID=A0A6J7P8L4_9ZZZZ|nr:hypothetical protein [Actinomycetota bacterium]